MKLFYVVFRIVEAFMNKHCAVNLVGDVSTFSMLDPWLRQAAADRKVSCLLALRLLAAPLNR